MAIEDVSQISNCLHELRQPLNVIGLATGNLRSALCPGLSPEQAEYLTAKLDRIDEQVARVATLADRMAEAAQEAVLAARQA
ncbi:histidine kinase dimerization/phospho-acceptor domain-containing protein [Novosphingobium sp.]|uniref:histidine kinase dimerization/phospho-acceptor domain-containing protein n=1 Tax=Novosphingobium sp. TaxID=1874826 RepID=UPI002611F702|nr:histidine kinase dimerization/phospho-acceptor domain-containing protein [Novosphingobium sp.]